MRLRSILSCLAGVSLAALFPLAAAAQQNCTVHEDADYTAQIKTDTTLPEFDTTLTDHMPVDSCVDTPQKFLGHIVGAPNVLDTNEQIIAYFRHLESQSKRVKVFSIGKSEEGHEMVMVAVSDEATIANLDHYRDITAKLADPRGLAASAADALIAEGKPMYWAAGSIHSTETGSPEMLMELAYRVAVENSPFIQNIRSHEIVLITPDTETDGRDRDVELYMHHKAHPDEPQPGLIWWGHYVDHDNNRDGLTLALDLSRNMMNAFAAWHPTVLHDLHESVPFLYVSTGTGPYNPWLDPLEINEWQRMAFYDIDRLNEQGVIGAWTHGFFDGWAPNYMLYVAIGHNAVGRFYETQGNGGADTRVVNTPATDTSREWYRPSPPLPRVNWSARDNINMQESGILFAMSNVATNHDEFLRDFYLKSLHSVDKATTEGPAAWIFPGNDPRPGLQARLISQLQLQKVEISRASEAFHAKATVPGGSATAEDHDFPAGSYIVRMDQPYSREADMLLGQEYYNPSDPSPYDDTGWTMGALADVQTYQVQDPAVLKVAMTRVDGDVTAPGGVEGSGSVFAINANSDPQLATFRYALASTPMQAAEQAFDADGKHFNVGTTIIQGDASAIANAAKTAGVSAVAISAAPSVPMHALEAPRIALVHNWQSTQQDGWYRIGMDQLHVPYSYIADTYLRVTSNLRDKYDVIILPPLGGTLSSMINGIPMTAGPPVPWKSTPDMPDLSPAGLDSTNDIRGGLGLSGVANLEQFVSQGGLLIAVGPSMAVATDTGFVGASTRQPQGLDARGDVLRAEVTDLNNPIAYGYSPDLDVYYSAGLLLSAGGGGRGGFGGGGRGGPGGEASRASGIGSPSVPDVMQTRPSDEVLYQDSLKGGGPQSADAGRGGRGGAAGPAPRTIVRFVPQAQNLLLSGLLSGGQTIAGQPLVVEARHGEGHIVLFAANPMWRNETSGEFSLVFNAAMNYKSLDAGAPAGGGGRGGRGRGGRGGGGK